MIDVTSPWLLLAAVGAMHLLAVASPGPAFVMVSRASATRSRASGIATGFGVATAALIWAVAASLGMDALLQRAPWIYRALQVGGGGYLLWIGIQSWRHASDPLPIAGSADPRTTGLVDAWLQGLKSNMVNPKIMVFFGSVFVSLFAPGTPVWVRIAAVGLIVCNEVLWYSFVAYAFSARPVQALYRRAKSWIDRAMGSLIGCFGLRLVLGGVARLGT